MVPLWTLYRVEPSGRYTERNPLDVIQSGTLWTLYRVEPSGRYIEWNPLGVIQSGTLWTFTEWNPLDVIHRGTLWTLYRVEPYYVQWLLSIAPLYRVVIGIGILLGLVNTQWRKKNTKLLLIWLETMENFISPKTWRLMFTEVLMLNIGGWKKTYHRSSRPKVFCEKGVFRNFVKFTGKHLCQSLFLNKSAGKR